MFKKRACLGLTGKLMTAIDKSGYKAAVQTSP